MELPADFLIKVKQNFPDDANEVIGAIQEGISPTSIRQNALKKSIPMPGGMEVPWCPHAFYLTDRPTFTLDPSFHAGAYYVQEASSMVLWHVLHQLNLPENPVILDLCAAPGGKSTLILDFLFQKGFLVANDVIKSRVHILEENIQKWGHSNVVVCQNDPIDFQKLPSYFDVVVVDAPCSGEGMFRKDSDAISEWSMDHVHHCALRQARIIDDVIPTVKVGGYIIYFTCTLNEVENIENVSQFARKHGLTSIEIMVEESWNLFKIQKSNVHGLQCLPGRNKGEGFFIAVLRKEQASSIKFKSGKTFVARLKQLPKVSSPILEKWVNQKALASCMLHENGNVFSFTPFLSESILDLLQLLNVRYSGTKCGQINKTLFLPDHALALSLAVNVTIANHELSIEDALKYLNKTLAKIQDDRLSWLLVTYQNNGLGWLKNLGSRINNYYPVEKRIRMDIN